jgi:threonine dehydratase
MLPPTFEDIVAAREFISTYLPKTPLVRIAKLSEELGCDYYAKLENLQPVGAFKVRGGVNLVGHFGTASDNDRVNLSKVSGKALAATNVSDWVNPGNAARQASVAINARTLAVQPSSQNTLITASTGNHGQSIAYAGRLFGVRVIIYAPTENVNEAKMQAMRDLGGEVRQHGRDFDEARMECERIAREEGFRYVHSANEPGLIAGVGTIGLEIFEDLPDVDVIIVPVGGGSCASGICIVANRLHPDVRIVAVQSEAAPATWHAWRDRTLAPYPTMKTEHEGLATRVPFELTNKILWDLLDDFVLVTDEEINEAIRLLARHAKQVAEGAGAASLAAAMKLRNKHQGRRDLDEPVNATPTSVDYFGDGEVRDRLRGKKVVGILTGGNITLERFSTLSAKPLHVKPTA